MNVVWFNPGTGHCHAYIGEPPNPVRDQQYEDTGWLRFTSPEVEPAPVNLVDAAAGVLELWMKPGVPSLEAMNERMDALRAAVMWTAGTGAVK